MAIWQIDLNFLARGRSWSESYFADFNLPSFAAITPTAVKLADLRIAMCAPPVEIVSYSVSTPVEAGQRGQTKNIVPIRTATGWGEQAAGDPATSVNASFQNFATQKSRRLYMRGVPDSVVTDFGQLKSTAYGTWKGLFDAWASYLLALPNSGSTGPVYGWLSREPVGAPAKCEYVIPVGGYLPVFTATPALFAGIDEESLRYVRVSGLNGRNSTLNREFVVRILSESTCQVVQPIAAFPMISPGQIRLYAEEPVFVPANLIEVSKTGTRRPGSPLLNTPGRAKDRPRG